MYIIRPNDINGLRNCGSIFDNVNFGLLRGEYEKVDLNLPKFQIESMLNLKPVLTKVQIKFFMSVFIFYDTMM